MNDRIIKLINNIKNFNTNSLTKACFNYHKSISTGIGGSSVCSCGMENSGSEVCISLRDLKDLILEAQDLAFELSKNLRCGCYDKCICYLPINLNQ